MSQQQVCLCRARNSPSQVTYKANDEVMMSARRQIAEQQQELERLRQETYVLKEAHQGIFPDLDMQQQVTELQQAVQTYKQQLEASQQQLHPSLHQATTQQQLNASQQQCQSAQQQLEALQHQLGNSQQQVAESHRQLSSSQQQVLSLTNQISTLQQQVQTQSSQLRVPHAEPGQVVLMPTTHGSQTLLVDQHRGKAYAERSTALQHVGTWTEQYGVQLTQPQSSIALGLERLHAFAKSQQHQLQQFFSLHAQNSTGAISIQLLPSLLSSILPATSSVDLQLLHVMLTVGSADSLTLQDLLAALETSLAAIDIAAAEAAVPQVLHQLYTLDQQQQSRLCELFEAQTGNLTGSITVQQLVHMLRMLDRGVSSTQLRCLLAKLHAQGAPDNVSLQDIHTALRLPAPLKGLSATHLRSSPTASPKAAGQTSSMSAELQRLRKQLAQATQAAQHHAQACSSKDAELVLLQRAVKQLQQDLQQSRQQEAAANALCTARQGSEALEAQIRAAGDKAHVLKTRFLETKTAFEQLKIQHSRVVKVNGQRAIAHYT